MAWTKEGETNCSAKHRMVNRTTKEKLYRRTKSELNIAESTPRRYEKMGGLYSWKCGVNRGIGQWHPWNCQGHGRCNVGGWEVGGGFRACAGWLNEVHDTCCWHSLQYVSLRLRQFSNSHYMKGSNSSQIWSIHLMEMNGHSYYSIILTIHTKQKIFILGFETHPNNFCQNLS